MFSSIKIYDSSSILFENLNKIVFNFPNSQPKSCFSAGTSNRYRRVVKAGKSEKRGRKIIKKREERDKEYYKKSRIKTNKKGKNLCAEIWGRLSRGGDSLKFDAK